MDGIRFQIPMKGTDETNNQTLKYSSCITFLVLRTKRSIVWVNYEAMIIFVQETKFEKRNLGSIFFCFSFVIFDFYE